MEIICNNEVLILSPLRAAYWPKKRTLFLADLHLGKTGYFRSHGIPIPSTVLHDDLKRLGKLIETYKAQKLIIAGDMFHHDLNTDINIFQQWREYYADISFILVPGNHDKLLHINYEQLDIQITSKEFVAAPFFITHELPEPDNNRFIIAGHLHPGYQLIGKARQSLRLPCFVVSSHHLILPAFSTFTGLFTGYKNRNNTRYYVIGNESVYRA